MVSSDKEINLSRKVGLNFIVVGKISREKGVKLNNIKTVGMSLDFLFKN